MSGDGSHPSNGASGQNDFLSRWSQRKVEARQKPVGLDDAVETDELSEAIQSTAATQSTATEEPAEELDLLSDDELLEHLDLPDPDTMQQGDDFTAFMKEAVPARLRNRALRKLWLSNPALANVDMLVDYGDDFTDAATVIPGMTTAYEVGKGIVRKIEELAEEDPAQEELASDAAAEDVEIGVEDVGTPADAGQDDDPAFEARVTDETGQDGQADNWSRQNVSDHSPESTHNFETEANSGKAESAEAAPEDAESDNAQIAALAVHRMRFSFDG